MSDKKVMRKLKASTRKHYVRKKRFNALQKEVKRLTKQLAQLEEYCKSAETPAKENQLKPDHSQQIKPDHSEQTGAQAENESKDSNPPDKLTLIKGIGPVLEKKLNATGIFRFTQIANWTSKEVEEFSGQLNFKGRIEREDWIRQAKELGGIS
jgi:large subunit ribosomal protein L21